MAGWRRAALRHLRASSTCRFQFQIREPRQHHGSFREFSSSAAVAADGVFDAGQPTFETHPELLASGEIMPGISSREFGLRREKLRDIVPAGSLVILASAMVKQMTDVVPYPFRQDADYLYFTGCQQPGGIAIIDDSSDLCMFMPDRSPERELWDGRLADPLAAGRVFGADQTYSIKQLPEFLPDKIGKAKAVLLDTSVRRQLIWSLPAIQEAVRLKKVQPIQNYTHRIRWIKSSSEIERMREVAAITCQAFLQTMLVSKHWPHESILAATMEYECKIRGAQRMSFPPVVGGGANASVIHYSRNDSRIRQGDMVLMDAGCELYGYVSDMTRCWPPSGTFSDAQREVYEVVLEAMKECLKMCRPHVTLREIHVQSGLILSRGLLKLGLAENGNSLGRTYLSFNPSAVGHYLGMDVHDCGAVSLDVPLQPGVIITIEPALYIPVKPTVPERYQGIGVRIEDEVLITPMGHEILTASAPKEVDEVESWLAQRLDLMHSVPFLQGGRSQLLSK
ncbi:unnamed protein product [Calypogeia fissa]